MALLQMIPEALPLATTEDQKRQPMQVFFSCGGKFSEMEVQRTETLRDVQKRLCKEFRERFPLMSAKLTKRKQQEFDEFHDILAGL